MKAQDALRYIDAAAGEGYAGDTERVQGLEHLHVAEPLREAAE